MSENLRKKVEPTLVSRLNSGNETMILETIDHLRTVGNPEYIPHLIGIFHRSGMETVKQSILLLLGELKDSNARSFLIEALASTEYSSSRKDLISCCWQNGLDFSGYLPFFVDLVIENEFETAFEAFTVIENMEHKQEVEGLAALISKTDKALETYSGSGSKSYLLQELRAILDTFCEGK